jgi:hypothetical protein
MIAHLMTHRAVLHRETATRDRFGDTVVTWTQHTTPAGLNARPDQNWSGTLQDSGPGDQQAGMRRWFLLAGFDVGERDVLQVVSGPEAPVLLRVQSVTKPTQTSPAVHHIEVNVEVWQGTLGAEEES